MNFDEYQVKAMRTSNEPNQRRRLENAALGLCGEAGEVADHVKKAEFHGHDLDVSYLEKELGDILWYVAQACDSLGVSMESVAAKNINKLLIRYPDGFSSERSRNR